MDAAEPHMQIEGIIILAQTYTESQMTIFNS